MLVALGCPRIIPQAVRPLIGVPRLPTTVDRSDLMRAAEREPGTRVAFAESIQSRSSKCTCKSCWITLAIHATNLIQLTQPRSQLLRRGSLSLREKVFARSPRV